MAAIPFLGCADAATSPMGMFAILPAKRGPAQSPTGDPVGSASRGADRPATTEEHMADISTPGQQGDETEAADDAEGHAFFANPTSYRLSGRVTSGGAALADWDGLVAHARHLERGGRVRITGVRILPRGQAPRRGRAGR